MRPIVITVLLLAASTAFGATQDKTMPEGENLAQRCAPKVISRKDAKSPEFHFREGETYRHSPVVAYEILESGETAHATLKRSSGVAEVDSYAVKSVQELKFNKRPGCGVVESTLDLTIDFR
jgi:hypothetical protein